MSGAATNPDPDVYAYAAATVKANMDVTHRLGGQNYVLWGGREGYETLLNTDLSAERAHAGRFLQQVVEYKHKIGFKGAILIEPKPQEPSKHQYDYDVATVYGFLKDFGLEREVQVNIEQGHAILAGHSFEHEIALAASLGIFGSIDMNRNDYQSGWDTDQFPNNHAEKAVAFYEILKAGGYTTGGTNFDAKIRRQSLDPEDLILAHVGGMDTCARALKCAAALLDSGEMEAAKTARYAGWESPAAKSMLKGSLDEAAARVTAEGLVWMSDCTFSGSRAMMPHMMRSEMPLPMPRSVICSPTHMRNTVPAVSVTTAESAAPKPGCRRACPSSCAKWSR